MPNFIVGDEVLFSGGYGSSAFRYNGVVLEVCEDEEGLPLYRIRLCTGSISYAGPEQLEESE